MVKYSKNYQLLDSWRGWAALWVMVFHGYNPYAGRQNFILENLPLYDWIATRGWFGVHLFFVISGYCLAANMSSAFSAKQGFGQFLQSRLLRIFPVYWCALTAQIFLQTICSPFNGVSWRLALPSNPHEAVASFLLLEPYFGMSSRMLVSWSLVYEWGFYVLMAAGLLYLQIQPRWIIAFSVAIMLALAGLLGLNQGILLTLRFWPEFMIGVCVFVFLQTERILYKAGALLLLLLFPGVEWILGGFSGSAVMTAGASGFGLLLCILRRWDKPLATLITSKWLKQAGLISYSLYLTHVPFGGAFRNLCMRYVSENSISFFLVQVGYGLTCLLFAYIFYLFVEAPWEEIRKKKCSHYDNQSQYNICTSK